MLQCILCTLLMLAVLIGLAAVTTAAATMASFGSRPCMTMDLGEETSPS